MNALIIRTNELAERWADAMAAVLWQSAILVAVVALAAWGLRRHSPAIRYWLWVALSAKLLLLPFWSVQIEAPASWASSSVVPASAPAKSAAPRGEARSSESAEIDPSISKEPTRTFAAGPTPSQTSAAATWQTWLLGAWTIAVLIQGARTILQLVGLRRLMARSQPADNAVAALVADCARRIRLARTPRVRQSDADASPFVCGVLRPTLLLPSSNSVPADAASLRQIVLHELAHIRRGDLWTIWAIHLMRVAYWFHPLAHWIAYRANLERELACDQLAMQHSGASAAAYARTLIHAAGRGVQPIALTAAGAAGLDGGAGGMVDL